MAIYKRCPYCKNKYEYGTQCSCYAERRKKANKDYDTTVRRSDINYIYDAFYHSKDWERLRDYIKIKYNGCCLHCLLRSNQIVTDRILIHHIIAIKDDWSKRLDERNLIPLCLDCHNDPAIHDNVNLCIELSKEFQRVYKSK